MNKSKIVEAFSEFIENWLGRNDVAEKPADVEITKALDEEQRMAMFVVLEPEAIDAHGDTYSAEEVEKACINFNTHCNKANLFHRVETEDAKIVQSFIAPSSFTLDDGREIKKGTWLQWWYIPETENGNLIWAAIKSGEIDSVSIGCLAKVEELDE